MLGNRPLTLEVTVPQAHLAYVPEHLHSRGLAMAFEELYQSQPVQKGELFNPKKGRDHVVARVNEGVWCIVYPGWCQGQLPGLLHRQVQKYVEQLGGTFSVDELQEIIRLSVLSVDEDEKSREVA